MWRKSNAITTPMSTTPPAANTAWRCRNDVTGRADARATRRAVDDDHAERRDGERREQRERIDLAPDADSVRVGRCSCRWRSRRRHAQGLLSGPTVGGATVVVVAPGVGGRGGRRRRRRRCLVGARISSLHLRNSGTVRACLHPVLDDRVEDLRDHWCGVEAAEAGLLEDDRHRVLHLVVAACRAERGEQRRVRLRRCPARPSPAAVPVFAATGHWLRSKSAPFTGSWNALYAVPWCSPSLEVTPTSPCRMGSRTCRRHVDLVVDTRPEGGDLRAGHLVGHRRHELRRVHGAAVAERGVRVGQLERRHDGETLTDRGVDVVTDEPAAVGERDRSVLVELLLQRRGRRCDRTAHRAVAHRSTNRDRTPSPRPGSRGRHARCGRSRLRCGRSTQSLDTVSAVGRSMSLYVSGRSLAPSRVPELALDRHTVAVRRCRDHRRAGRRLRGGHPRNPFSIAAYAVNGLKVEPGAYSPWMARLRIGL